MVRTWRVLATLLGGVLLVAPLTVVAAQAAGDTGGGPLVAGVVAGVGLALLRLAGLPEDQG